MAMRWPASSGGTTGGATSAKSTGAAGRRGGGGQGIGQLVEACFQIVDLGCLEQAEVAFRQAVGAFRQGAEPAHAGRQAGVQHLGMARAADAVGEHAGEGQAGPVAGQAVGDGAEGLGHGAGVDQGHDRNGEALGDVGGRRRAVEQAHDAFDQDQVGFAGRAGQAPARVGLAAHAEVEVLAGPAAGDGVNLRIEKIGAALEDGDAPPLAGMQAGQRRGDGGLALAGGGGGDEQGGTGRHGLP
jgi:hypothetical protein